VRFSAEFIHTAPRLGVPVVTAFQVCRRVAVLVLVEPLYRLGWLR